MVEEEVKEKREQLIANVKKFFSNKNETENDIYWFHAASLGEYEQIKPVLAGLKEIEPSSKSIVSFFSPSGYNHVNDQNIDCKIYLPFDFFWIINRCLKIVKPKKTILTNLHVDMDYFDLKKKLPKNIVPAFDSLCFNF